MSTRHLQTTKGIVLRTVKYGETSLIVKVYTDLYGVQSYLLNGVRTASPNGSAKAHYFQPAAILELVVYHNEFKKLQRIREYKWAHLYQQLFFDIHKNSVALFLVELLQKILRQPEPNPDLFAFLEDALLHLDRASPAVTANFPLFMLTQLTSFSGFRITDSYSAANSILDLQEGRFVADPPAHMHVAGEPHSALVSQLLKVMQPRELEEFPLNQETRRALLKIFLTFFDLHIPEFGKLKTVNVLQSILI